jgi:hypothetical protein
MIMRKNIINPDSGKIAGVGEGLPFVTRGDQQAGYRDGG